MKSQILCWPFPGYGTDPKTKFAVGSGLDRPSCLLILAAERGYCGRVSRFFAYEAGITNSRLPGSL